MRQADYFAVHTAMGLATCGDSRAGVLGTNLGKGT